MGTGRKISRAFENIELDLLEQYGTKSFDWELQGSDSEPDNPTLNNESEYLEE